MNYLVHSIGISSKGLYSIKRSSHSYVAYLFVLICTSINFLSFFFQTFNLDDRNKKKSLSSSIGRINKITSTPPSISKVSVELVRGKRSTVFETHAGRKVKVTNSHKADESKVLILVLPFKLVLKCCIISSKLIIVFFIFSLFAVSHDRVTFQSIIRHV